MHLSPLWLAPLSAGAAAAVVLGLLARSLRQRVYDLQRAMRPLRTGERRPRPPAGR